MWTMAQVLAVAGRAVAGWASEASGRQGRGNSISHHFLTTAVGGHQDLPAAASLCVRPNGHSPWWR
jgi:hypothetical protein